MNPSTLIIGYVPLTDTTGKKPSELRNDLYFKELKELQDWYHSLVQIEKSELRK